MSKKTPYEKMIEENGSKATHEQAVKAEEAIVENKVPRKVTPKVEPAKGALSAAPVFSHSDPSVVNLLNGRTGQVTEMIRTAAEKLVRKYPREFKIV